MHNIDVESYVLLLNEFLCILYRHSHITYVINARCFVSVGGYGTHTHVFIYAILYL